MIYSKKPYIIAETACNHEGDLGYLIKTVDLAKEAKADAIKFHLLFDIEGYFQKNHPLAQQVKSWMFSEVDWGKTIKHAVEKGLEVIVLCNDMVSLNYILNTEAKIKAIELHSTSLNDYYMLDKVKNYPGQIILGIGGSTIDEIAYALEFFRPKDKNDILLMYGFQSYPTNYQDINLQKMLKIRELFDVSVGYADHTGFDDQNNVEISALPAAMGVNILEKHLTPEPGVERIDYHAAVGKDKLAAIREKMELNLAVYGNGGMLMSDSESKYGNTGPMKKAIVAKRNIKKGDNIGLEDLTFKRTVELVPIKQKDFAAFIGSQAILDIAEDEPLDFTKVKIESKKISVSDLTGRIIKEKKE